MGESLVDSVAFRRALLQSERRRIFGVMAFVAIFAGIRAARIWVFGSPLKGWGLVALLLLGLYEFFLLRAVTHALQSGRDLPGAVWALGVVLEMSVPAIGIAWMVDPRLELAYRPLATPWVLFFFPLIMLTTLRLNPRMSQMAGAIAAVGYLLAAWHHGWRFSLENPAGNTVTQFAVAVFALFLLASGFIAGQVGKEIRKYVEAALKEAETERLLKQVQHDLQIAQSIQRSLLPKVRPKIEGFEIAGWNRSADATGGDYFDWKQLADGRLVITMADVTGHGIGPALLASVCRAYSRASFDAHATLPITVQRINQSFGEDITPGSFATFVAAVCNGDTGQVELFAAGQGPSFVYSAAKRTCLQLDPQSMPLGLMPELLGGLPVILDLENGDVLALITDGFFEWENSAREQFGLERVSETICRCSHLPPEEMIAELYDSVLTFSNGTKQQDDLTAVVIKRNGTTSGTHTLQEVQDS